MALQIKSFRESMSPEVRCYFGTTMQATALHFLLLTVSGWVNRRQLAAIDYLREENRLLRAHLGPKRIRLTDGQRRALAEKGRRLGRKALTELASIATPDTILRWYRQLIAKQYEELRGASLDDREKPRPSSSSCCAWHARTPDRATHASWAR